MSDMHDLFEKSTELAAQCGEYEDDFFLKAEIGDRITIYARIHACSELLIYTPSGCCYHAFEDYNQRVSVAHFTPGTWMAAIETAYAELVDRKPIR